MAVAESEDSWYKERHLAARRVQHEGFAFSAPRLRCPKHRRQHCLVEIDIGCAEYVVHTQSALQVVHLNVVPPVFGMCTKKILLQLNAGFGHRRGGCHGANDAGGEFTGQRGGSSPYSASGVALNMHSVALCDRY